MFNPFRYKYLPEPLFVYGRIKPGTRIFQDFTVSTWPVTKAEVFSGVKADPDTRFQMYTHPNGDVVCVAPGYGDRRAYGNGSIYILPSHAH